MSFEKKFRLGGDSLVGTGASFHTCPYCTWSLFLEGETRYDYAGIEAALEDHLNEVHPGWTIEQLRAATSEGDE